MLRWLSTWFSRLFGEARVTAPRSPDWSRVRAAHLLREPTCQACGSAKGLEVHHIVPVHVDPSLELVDSNLITLCEAPSHSHHYTFGHAENWRGWNPQVRSDAEIFRSRVAWSDEQAQSRGGKEEG